MICIVSRVSIEYCDDCLILLHNNTIKMNHHFVYKKFNSYSIIYHHLNLFIPFTFLDSPLDAIYQNNILQHKYLVKQYSENSGRLKHPFLHPSIDTHLESLCSKFPLAIILRWRDMRNNMNILLHWLLYWLLYWLLISISGHRN